MKQKRRKDQAKNEAILKAAAQLFLRHGYSNTSMDAIAAAARVTKQTVYAHCKSKDALFVQMVAGLCDAHVPDEVLLDEAQPVDKLLYNLGMSFLDMVTSEEGLAMTRLVISETLHHPKLAQRYYEGNTLRVVAMLAKFLARQNKRGTLSVPHTASAASHFFSMLKGQYHLRMLFAITPLPGMKEKEAHVREVVSLFMKLYGGAKPARTRGVL